MLNSKKTYNLITFFSLYIAQTIPMSFFSTIIPVMMRQDNFKLSSIGLLQLIKLPWILKFLWSPIVDRHTKTTGDFKRWIISSELIYAVMIFIVAFLDFKTDFYLIIAMIIFSFFASATQDIATDAMAVLSFEKKEKSMVNSMQSMGSFGGALIGGSVLLYFLNQGFLNDMRTMLILLAIFVIIALMPLIFNRKLETQVKSSENRANMSDIISFFTQKGISRQIFFLLLVYAGLTGTLAMLRPYMVDMHLSTSQIGLFNGLGTCMGCVFAFAGGYMVKHLGRFFCRRLFAILVLISSTFFIWMYLPGNQSITALIIGICLLWSSYGLSTIIVYTTSMDIVRKGREGIDFTLQTVVTHISGIIAATAGGFIAHKFGYTGLAIVETAIAAASLIYIFAAFKKNIDSKTE